MTQESIPEILRCPLDRVVLFSKMLELNEPPQAILALLMDPPNLSNIESTIWKLKEVSYYRNFSIKSVEVFLSQYVYCGIFGVKERF